jgi:hypothetical protein
MPARFIVLESKPEELGFKGKIGLKPFEIADLIKFYF